MFALAATPRHTPSPKRQLGSYLHDTKFPWSLDPTTQDADAPNPKRDSRERLQVESSAGGHAYEDTDGALGRKALAAAATAVLAGLAF